MEPPIPIDQLNYPKPKLLEADPLRLRYTCISVPWGYNISDGVIINTNLKDTVHAAV
jgi:hypothetical protein